jgi:hypothetical protein
VDAAISGCDYFGSRMINDDSNQYAFDARILASVSFFGTDIHSESLGTNAARPDGAKRLTREDERGWS